MPILSVLSVSAEFAQFNKGLVVAPSSHKNSDIQFLKNKLTWDEKRCWAANTRVV